MTETTLSETMSPTAIADRHLAAYGEPDPIRRRALLEAAWGPDGTLVDPPLEGVGHAGIADLGVALQTHYPGHTFRRTTAVDEHHGFARYGWDLVGPDGAVAFGGVDVVEFAADGRLAGVVGFLGDLASIEA